MITDEGVIHIKRYVAGWVPAIGLSMAFGAGEKPASVTDKELQFEVGRANIELTTYDFVQDKLVFKASLPEDFDATIHEVGLFSLESNYSSGDFGSRIISSFDSDTEAWMQGSDEATYSTANTRVGVDSVLVAPAASGSVTVVQSDTYHDLSGYSAADEFSFAFFCGNTNTSSIRYRFKTDATNYYDVTVPTASISAGFNVVRISKGAATVTGVPNWGDISSVEVTVNSKASGVSEVHLEGIRIEDMDTISPDYVMVARVVLSNSFEKVSGRIQEIEFPLGVTVNDG